MKNNPYNFNFKPLTNDQMLLDCVKANVSVFLHGPSGVGKSSRVRQIDPTATFITLRPQMNPEEIDGVLNRETGEYIPPLWYTQLVKKCKDEPNKMHVLFIDELTNVKPTVQSLIYSIVLDRKGKDGLWPLPDNAVVIGAGNEAADVSAAYPLTGALYRRFCHIYYEVNVADFLNWANDISDTSKAEEIEVSEKPSKKLHPAIYSYIRSRGENVLYSDYDEDEPKICVDPRKWEIASHLLYVTKNPNSLLMAIGAELTADFVQYVKEIPLSVEDVLNKNYDKNRLVQMGVDKKIATAMALTDANEKQIKPVRVFVKKYLGEEVLAQFDLTWIGENDDRALLIAGIMEDEGDVNVK